MSIPWPTLRTRIATLKAARRGLAEGSDVVVIGFHTDRPTGYGRLLVTDGELVAIREEKDASEDERKITWCNSGLMAINARKALDLLSRIGNGNAILSGNVVSDILNGNNTGVLNGVVSGIGINTLGNSYKLKKH